MSSDYAIELNNVWKRYSTKVIFHNSLREKIVGMFSATNGQEGLREGEFWALQGVDISVSMGECIGIYGPNGSGKSTILKLIASVTFPNKGEVNVKGTVAPLISVGAGFHPDLTGRENIYMNGTIIGMSIADIKNKIEDIIQFSELEQKFIAMPVKKYSSGMALRLGFAVAVHTQADIFLFDEIIAVGDASFRDKCIDKIEELKKDSTIIVVLHNRELLEKITDRIVFIERGRVVSQ